MKTIAVRFWIWINSKKQKLKPDYKRWKYTQHAKIILAPHHLSIQIYKKKTEIAQTNAKSGVAAWPDVQKSGATLGNLTPADRHGSVQVRCFCFDLLTWHTHIHQKKKKWNFEKNKREGFPSNCIILLIGKMLFRTQQTKTFCFSFVFCWCIFF